MKTREKLLAAVQEQVYQLLEPIGDSDGWPKYANRWLADPSDLRAANVMAAEGSAGIGWYDIDTPKQRHSYARWAIGVAARELVMSDDYAAIARFVLRSRHYVDLELPRALAAFAPDHIGGLHILLEMI